MSLCVKLVDGMDLKKNIESLVRLVSRINAEILIRDILLFLHVQLFVPKFNCCNTFLLQQFIIAPPTAIINRYNFFFSFVSLSNNRLLSYLSTEVF